MREIFWTEEKANKIWEFYSSNPEFKNQYFSWHSGEYIINELEKYIPLKSLKTILDFGCGPGFLMEHFLNYYNNYNVYGLDFSRSSIEKTNELLAGRKGFAGAFWVGQLPSTFQDNSMDMVISVEVIEHLYDYQLLAMIQEASRVLKPDGYLVITTPNNENLGVSKTMCPDCGVVFHKWQHIRSFDGEVLQTYVEKYDFQTIIVKEALFQNPANKFINNSINFAKRNTGRKGDQYLPHLYIIAKKIKP